MIITLAQIETESNLDLLKPKLEEIFRENAGSDLIAFPELFNTPFLLDEISRHAKDSPAILSLMQKLCKKYECWCVAGSLAWREKDKYYNRSYVINPRGEIVGSYDKMHGLEVHSRHSFIETELFTEGDHLLRIDTGKGVIGIVVCYDIRFPELARAYDQSIDLLVVPAAFNEQVGQKHWQALLQARAIENEIFVAGINPAFKDYGAYRSYGHSMIVGPDGEVVLQLDKEPGAVGVKLELDRVEKIRQRSPYWKIRKEELYPQLVKQIRKETT